MLASNVAIALATSPKQIHLIVDWLGEGYGYVLYGLEDKRILSLGLNSKSVKDQKTSNFLDELSGIVWALKDVKFMVGGKPLTIWTDSESANQRIKSDPKDKDLGDNRVSGMLGWLWGNFHVSNVDIRFPPGNYNSAADWLSKSCVKSGVKVIGAHSDEEDKDKR